MRWIYLSPHLDDAVLSAGGLIYDQAASGIPVEIWTLLCGYPPGSDEDLSPFAQLQHTLWGFASAEVAIRSRRAEDENAAATLGATTVHFDFLDCIYRQAPNGEWLYWDIFLPPRPEDAALPAQMAEAIAGRIRPEDVLVCQLSVGSHVDHVLVRQAAELLGRPLLYDIDVPYVLSKPEQLPLKNAGMQESIYPISESGLSAWKQAILAYRSQVPLLGEAFDTAEKVRAAIQAYWAQVRGIRLLQLH